MQLIKITGAKGPDLAAGTKLYYQLYPGRKKGRLTKMRKPKFKSEVFVAKEGKSVIGFVLVTFYSYAKSTVGYIDELIVDKRFRGRGIGSRLVLRALSWAKGLGAEVVFVTTDDEADFYKRLNFRASKKNVWLLWTPKDGLPMISSKRGSLDKTA